MNKFAVSAIFVLILIGNILKTKKIGNVTMYL